MKNIGHWQGVAMGFSFSLRDLGSFIGVDTGPLSYIVVLHGENDFGPILAAGELKAEDIDALSMPSSRLPVFRTDN